jgi:hypothetical protein
MLAGDPDEALDQAERYLAEHALSSYYDEVALQGLQLAANDVIRDVLSPDKVERFKSAVNELVRDLDGYDDEPPKGADRKKTVAGPSLDEQALPSAPPPAGQAEESDAVPPEWRSETPVLCVAGRGPLDEAASSMLAQLLQKHGLGARVLPYEAVSRSNIGAVDLRDVAMVCVSYIDISGNPPHLRYLLHRLRQRLPPRARLLVGLWPADDPVLRNPELGRAIGADYYANTLRQAVEKCFEARSTAHPEPPAAPSGRQPAPSLAAADHAV